MKFIEVVDGFAINIDSIVSVRDVEGSLKIETEDRDYTVQGDFKLFLSFLQSDQIRKEKTERMTTQFFGG